jgi:hypothetical protein
MTELSYRKKKNNIRNTISILLIFIFFFAFKYHFKEKWFGNKKSVSGSEQNLEQAKSILSKQENLLSIEEWKKIADYRAQEYYECTKDLDMDLTKSYLWESCATDYSNSGVLFRDGLDERANLNYDQQKMLKDYWSKTSDAMINKVSKMMEENDRKLRPNQYKDN